jgi:hypothetical protein
MEKKIFLLVYLILIFRIDSFSQAPEKTDRLVSNYVHIADYYSAISPNVIGFSFKNRDTSDNFNWQSQKLSSFETAGKGEYYVKINIPESILSNSKGLWCTAYMLNGKDTIEQEYGGTTLSTIRLNLKSTPEGAESFLIPSRIWDDKFENANWQGTGLLDKYQVNTSSTNTYAFVDETVYVVVFKKGNKYKKVIHRTKPAKVENIQTVSLTFDE